VFLKQKKIYFEKRCSLCTTYTAGVVVVHKIVGWAPGWGLPRAKRRVKFLNKRTFLIASLARVAIRFIFIPKITIWVYFGEPLNGRCCYILCDLLEYFTAILYNILSSSIVCGHLVYFSALVCLDQEKSGNPGLASGLGTNSRPRFLINVHVAFFSRCEQTNQKMSDAENFGSRAALPDF
jgi:hypothetical protein